ncbi:unnamed protein product [Adineta ricciae]|uniref:Uncharacterized protein n=1 Tax=Adineta ricciae TaxID=249248 RepID=A0A816G1C4_ADIRI|nr:unnamed protein product [Adineta ricciae]
MPCVDPAVYSNKLKQQKTESNLQTDQYKRRRPISAGYSLTNTLPNGRPGRATTANRPSRSGNANGTENVRNEYFGLSQEEIRILRTVKEESRQRGGFVRIFPTSDTYEFFSSFFEQRTTSFNQMIHQRLYPSRWSSIALNSQSNNGSIRRTTAPRCKLLSSAFNYGHSSEKDLTPKTSGCDLDEALERYRIYERRLIDIAPPSYPHSSASTITTTNVSETSKTNDNLSKSQTLPDNFDQNPSRLTNLHRTTSVPPSLPKSNQKTDSSPKRLTTVGQLVKSTTTSAPGESRHSIYAKNDILQMLNQGLTLSPLQARTAFGTYLQRIQFRLMLDSEFKEEVTSSQHMDLVIRFLRRAGQNLTPPFRVEIPSRRLSQSDQKRILAKELCDFLHLYNKETVSLNPTSLCSTVQIDHHLFENFLRSASEADLEQMMTAYMKTNKESAIHLGVNPKVTKSNSDIVGADQQAQTISTKPTSYEEKTITIIQTMSPNEQQTWATTTQNQLNKRLLRASSASKPKTNQKKEEQIYKLYGVTRPVSALISQKRQLTVATPDTKVYSRDRPNSANVSIEQKRDFTEQLTELSTKQHRRQYSGRHHLNVYESRSPSNERNSNENCSTKQEEILEKSRQILEESKVKNEQLAEQAKVFQRTLQRQEIYSALNRFGHRPPIYPTVIKESRISSSKSQQN